MFKEVLLDEGGSIREGMCVHMGVLYIYNVLPLKHPSELMMPLLVLSLFFFFTSQCPLFLLPLCFFFLSTNQFCLIRKAPQQHPGKVRGKLLKAIS